MIEWGMSDNTSKQFLVNRSYRLARRMALTELNALQALPVYPVFEDEKVKWVKQENWSTEKLHKKRPQD